MPFWKSYPVLNIHVRRLLKLGKPPPHPYTFPHNPLQFPIPYFISRIPISLHESYPLTMILYPIIPLSPISHHHTMFYLLSLYYDISHSAHNHTISLSLSYYLIIIIILLYYYHYNILVYVFFALVSKF